MPFKSVSTVFNPGEVKILEFKIGMFNKKLWTSLSPDTKKNAIDYLDRCIEYIHHYRKWVAEDIVKDVHEKIKVSMKDNPITGAKCNEYGFANDSMGEMFDPKALYVAELNESGDGLIIVPLKP